MKILRVAVGLPPKPGGLEIHAAELSLEQARAGHDVRVIHALGGGPHNGSGYQTIRIAPLRSARPARVNAFSGAIFGARALLKSLPWQWRPDIVHGHGDSWIALIVALFAKRFDAARALTIHGGLREDRLYRMIAKTAFQRMDAIIAVSPGIAGQLASMDFPNERIRVIPSGIRIERLAAAARNGHARESRAFRIMAVGRLTPVKGFEYLIAAAHELQKRELDFDLHIFGDGPCRAALAVRAQGLRQVHFHGNQSQAAIADALRASDAFILPSITLPHQSEGTPTSLLEAMAAGLPIVTTQHVGQNANVVDGVNGLIVPERDSTALANAMQRLMQQCDLSIRMGAANVQSGQSRDWPLVAKQIEQVYLAAAARRREK